MIVVFHTQAAEIMPSTTQRVEVILKNLGTRVRPIFVGRQIEVEEVVWSLGCSSWVAPSKVGSLNGFCVADFRYRPEIAILAGCRRCL